MSPAKKKAQAPKPRKLITGYTVERDGKPTRISESFDHFPHNVVAKVLLDSDQENRSIVDPSPEMDTRASSRKWCLRMCRSAIKRTKALCLDLENSMHYDCNIAKQIGSYESKYEIVRLYEDDEQEVEK